MFRAASIDGNGPTMTWCHVLVASTRVVTVSCFCCSSFAISWARAAVLNDATVML